MRSRITTVAIAMALIGAFAAPASAAQAASATVSGVVEYKGSPVAGIPVGWFTPSSGSYRTVTSAADGSYSLTLPEAGQDYVLFGNLDLKKPTKPGRGNVDYVGVFYGDGDVRDYAYQTLDYYTAASTADVVDIELAKPATLIGSNPKLLGYYSLENLGGGEVKQAEALGPNDGSTVEIRFANLVPGQYRVVPSAAYDNVEVSDEIVTALEGETVRFDLEARAGGTIAGVVTGPNGKPVRNLQVVARAVDGAETDSDSYITDSKGRYWLKHLDSASYEVTYGTTGTTASRNYTQLVDIVDGVTEQGVVRNNVMVERGGRISGTIPWSSTKGYNQVTIVGPDGHILETDVYVQSGTFTIASLAAGKYTIYLTNEKSTNYGKAVVNVMSGKTAQVGKLSRPFTGRTVSGTVSGFPAGGVKGEDVIVVAHRDGGPAFDTVVQTNGRYALRGIVPGTYEVNVVRYSRETSSTTVSVNASKNAIKNLAVGPRLGKVRATFSLAGKPVDDGSVLLYKKDERWPSVGLTLTITDGLASGSAAQGSYSELYALELPRQFQPNSPYWVSLPDDVLPTVVTPETTTNLGEVELEVKPSLRPAE